MRVFQDPDTGKYHRQDGQPGFTCPLCGNGYDSVALVAFHMDDCPAESLEEAPTLPEGETIVGKTIAASAMVPIPSESGFEPTTVLLFTDGTACSFVHPTEER